MTRRRGYQPRPRAPSANLFVSSRRATLAAALLIVLATAAAYSGSFNVPFIFDDEPTIVENRTIRHLWPIWDALFPPNACGETVSGRPLLNLSLAVNYAISDSHAWSYHAGNLAIHILAALLLFGVLRRTFLLPALREKMGAGSETLCDRPGSAQKREAPVPIFSWAAVATPLALIIALLWALHPLQTESVTYVVQRAESLVGLFYLLTLYCTIRGAELELPSSDQPSVGARKGAGGEGTRAEADTSGLLDAIRPHPNSLLKKGTGSELNCEKPAKDTVREVPVPLFQQAANPRPKGEGTAAPSPRPTNLRSMPGEDTSVRNFRKHSASVQFTKSTAWYAAAVAACLLGMASKEVMVSAPLIVLLYDRAFLAGSFREAWRRRFGLYLALAATWLLLGGLALSTGNRGGTAGFGTGIGCWAYLGTQFGAIVRYLWLSVWPHPLVFDYGSDTAHGLLAIGPYAIGVVLLGLATLLALWRWPKVGFLGAWFFAILAPTSSVVPVATQTIAEHRMYLPLAAVLTGVVVGGYLAGRRLVDRGRISPQTFLHARVALAACVVTAFGILTIVRNGDYRSPLSIWADTAKKAPHNARAHNNVGLALVDLGNFNQAIIEHQKAVEPSPDPSPYVRRETPKFYYNLALALEAGGRHEEAIAQYEKALQLRADFERAHNNLGNVLADLGRVDEAIAHYEKAVALNPQYADAHYNFGIALAQQARFREAATQYERAVEYDPDNVETIETLSLLLATCPEASVRNGARAVALAEKARLLSGGQDPAVLDAMAAAYAEAGRFSEAVQTAYRAIQLAVRQNKPVMADAIRTRVKLYESGSPCRDIRPNSGTVPNKPQ